MSLCQPQPAEAQARSETQCEADICLQTGESNWYADPSEYCEAGVCLRDSLESLVSLKWDRVTAEQGSLIVADANPFIGLTDAEYQRLREASDDDIEERLQLLGKVRISCQIGEFSTRLDIPGYDTVEVTFGTPLASNGGSQEFQVIRIDRIYRGLPGGSIGSWIRWVTYRFPQIVLMKGSPTAFANYAIGLYVGHLVLYDKEFQYGRPADYGKHPDCLAR